MGSKCKNENEDKRSDSNDMAIFDKEQILRYLQYVEVNESPLTEEEVERYKRILEAILKDPNLEAFLDKKFGEIISTYIIDNPNILENAQKHFIRNEDGMILLDEQGYTERKHNGPGVYAIKWIMVSGIPVLVKGMDEENNPYTTLISEQIAREAGYEVATYYPAILDGKHVVVTPNFLKLETAEDGTKQEEEIISGKKISAENMDLRDNPELIKRYFSERGVSPEVIDNLIEKYKSVMLYNIFINARDGHNGNWGVIKGLKDNYKFTPVFDLEGGLAENELRIRPIHVGNSWEDDDMLKFLLQDDKTKSYAEKLLGINMDSVYANVEKSKKVKIPDVIKAEDKRLIMESQERLARILAERSKAEKIRNNDDTGLR